MDATKLTVSPDTLRFQRMSRGKKAKLRRQNIIDLIRSRPYGTAILYTDFAAVTQTSQTAARGVVKTMVRQGIISQDQIGHKYTYRVNGPVTTRQLGVAKPIMPTPPPSSSPDRRPTFSQRLRQRILLGNQRRFFARICCLDR